MDQNFQTSFIPKKPMVEERMRSARPVGLLTVLSICILFTVLIATAGFYFYRGLLVRNITTMQNDLNLAKERFEPSKITELKVLDRRLNAAVQVLDKHIAITPIFEALQDITMKTVRYTKFSYGMGEEKDAKVVVKLQGAAVGYRSIALQSDLYTTNEHMIDPVFSNLTLDDKGNVLFDLEFSVDPGFVDYQQILSKSSGVIAP